MYGERRSFAPVNVGDEIDVKIEAVGAKGDGIARKKGFVLFVPNTKEGDEVKVRVTKVLRKVGFAEVVGEATSSPEVEEKPQEAPAAEAPQPEETPEDTEDFGEEETEKDIEETETMEDEPEEEMPEPEEEPEEEKE